ncbi:hypothetical protein C0J52_08325 [Blattella germanica]|nr:hypothetical protein C0J52_08325 [Blattella germanica]
MDFVQLAFVHSTKTEWLNKSFFLLVSSQIQNLKDHLSQNEFLNPAVSFNELLPYPSNTTSKCTSSKQTAVLPENILGTVENGKRRRKLFPQQNVNKQVTNK